MKMYIYLSLLATMFVVQQLEAQENSLEEQKETIRAEEREALKAAVEAINEQLDREEITYEQAQGRKEAAAEKHALNIENRIAILENETAYNQRNESDSLQMKTRHTIGIYYKKTERETKDGESPNRVAKRVKRRYSSNRHYGSLVFALGLNNALAEGGSLDDSPFKVGGSRFAELGWAWNTSIFKERQWLWIRYGFSFQFNGLKPTDNRYFVEDGDQTHLETFEYDLRKSKFRMDNLVAPIHFEINTFKGFKLGLGGYAGVNLGTRQKLRYTDADGNRQSNKWKRGYNTNNLIYGLSAYVGWDNVALYAKYDLNPIFIDNPVAQRNISLGLRFDMD